ncbi:MAG: hypothetical protein V1910_02275 [bacterium]
MEEKDLEKKLINSQNQNNTIIKMDTSIIFNGDPYGLFVFQKADKLIEAIYLLTNLMSDKEPMKERIRMLANKMLENVLGMSERIWGEEIFQKNLLSAINEISILFDIAKNIKMFSKMNHQIIVSELQKLANFLTTSSANYSSAKIAFEPNLFDSNYNYVSEQTFQTPSFSQDTNINKDNFIKDINYSNKGQNFDKGQLKNDLNKKMSFTKTIIPEKNIKDKNDRQTIILSMLKSGIKLTMKDFAQNIKNCSEKTIQRELLILVAKGVLKREGKRRWVKYFLK